VVLSASAEAYGRPCLELTSNVITIPLDDSCHERNVRIGKDHDLLVRDDIVCVIGQYKDVFAFDPFEMSGIAPDVMQHRLSVDPNQKPVIKKRRHLGAECGSG